ncbi:unnamed protein product [Absidia cylindrospora]
MVCGALSLEERNKRSNTHFIGAVQGKDGLSAIHMVPALAQDLERLEQGVTMMSALHGEDVLVIAPLVFITADNPRHSQISCLFILRHILRKFEDNNSSAVSLKKDSCAIFKKHDDATNSIYFIGKVDNDGSVVQYWNLGVDCFGYTIATASEKHFCREELDVVCILDMHMTNVLGHFIVNHTKFGAAWFLKRCGMR